MRFMFLLFLTIFVNNCAAQQRSTAYTHPTGVWKVIGVYEGHVVAITADEANSLIGKSLVLSDSVFSFIDHYFYKPKISIKIKSTNEVFPIFRRYAYEAGIESDSIKVIKVESKDGSEDIHLIENDDSLIYSCDGWFFFLKKE